MNNNIDITSYLLGKKSGGGGSSVDIQELNITENGTYSAPSGVAYSPVRVDVPQTVDSQEDALIERTISGEYRNDRVTKIGRGAFAYCMNIRSVDFPRCTLISINAFTSCQNLTSISFPICSYVSSAAFFMCSRLTSVYLPECTFLDESAFRDCTALETISLPKCEKLSRYAIHGCRKLKYVSLPLCSYIGSQALGQNSVITSITLPMCTTVGDSGAFNYCYSLTTVNLPVCQLIGRSAFAGCSILTSVMLASNSVCALASSNAFVMTPIAGSTTPTGGVYGSIYVPASLISSYQAATNWTYFSERFAAIEDLPTE